MSVLPNFPVIVVHLESPAGSGLAACCGLPLPHTNGWSTTPRSLCQGCVINVEKPMPPEQDSCPCGHTDNEHVHYCSTDVLPFGSCGCNAEYARIEGTA